ncbi:MAG: hypothetical protein R3C20_17555 [Planctomycetaceae bacterium]
MSASGDSGTPEVASPERSIVVRDDDRSQCEIELWNLAEGSTLVIASSDLRSGIHSVRIELPDEAVSGSQVDAAESPSPRLLPERLKAVEDETVPHLLTASPGEFTSRRFMFPRFHENGFELEMVVAVPVAHSENVLVYATDSTSPNELSDLMKVGSRICQICEKVLLPRLKGLLGDVEDLDSDGRISLVIGRLDRRDLSVFSATDMPVQGCVKRSDYEWTASGHLNDFGGDIVYLDHGILQTPSLQAVLMHELTHAVIYSHLAHLYRASVVNPAASGRTKTGLSMPAWLNEAVAHLMELAVEEGSENYRIRRSWFESKPNLSPVVLPEHGESLATRRGGARAAGTRFLQSLQLDQSELQSLLYSGGDLSGRLHAAVGRDFPEAFTAWIESEAADLSYRGVAASLPATSFDFQLRGTAFHCFRVTSPLRWLRITSDDRSDLIVRVLKVDD